MDDSIIRIVARLDASQTGEDLKNLEQRLNAKGVTIKPEFDGTASRKEIRSFAKQLKMTMEQAEPSMKSFGIRKYMAAIKSELAAAQSDVAKQPPTPAPYGFPELGKSSISAIAGVWSRFNKFAFSAGIYRQAIFSIAQSVYDLESAMSSLCRVTEETEARYERFWKSSAASARELGRSVTSMVTQTGQWAEKGYSFDDSEDLARISSLYANMSGVDDKTAVDHMAEAMKAFHMEAEQSVAILDQISALSSAYSIGPADLGEGLNNSASAMSLANNDIQETLAMIAGGAQITHEAGNIGSALKVSSLRLKGMKDELKELGAEAENVLSPGQMQDGILDLTGGAVDIFDGMEPGKLKSTYDILLEISKVWDDISQTNQADNTCLYVQKCA